MPLSRNVVDTLVDLIENKLAVLQIGDRDDLREVLALQNCLSELRRLDLTGATAGDLSDSIPRRGRHRKVSALMDDLREELVRQHA